MKTQKKYTRGHIAGTVVIAVVLLLFAAVCFTGLYIHATYPNEKLDELTFYLRSGVENSDTSVISAAAGNILPRAGVTALILLLPQLTLFSRKWIVGRKHRIQLYPIKHRFLFTLIASVLLCVIGLQSVGTFRYLKNEFVPSDFIYRNYVDPKTAAIAPEKPRNLIIIELESMETTVFTKEHGGIRTEPVIPELEALYDDPDAVSFATDDGYRGTAESFGSTWTTAALVSYTSALPFKVPADLKNKYHSDHFMKGAFTLGDVLAQDGYDNTLLSGSATSFGGVADYFTAHGNYTLIDKNTCADLGFTYPESQKNKFGFSDEVLFSMARTIVTEKRETGRPYHLFISTIDTHFIGYTYPKDEENGMTGSVTSYPRKLNNVYATTSREAGAFVEWLRGSGCLADTTVVVIGDHLNMLDTFAEEYEQPRRGRYNLFLGAVSKPEKTKNRVFTALDFCPTVLAAMGYTIDGERMGLGVNLFSNEPTLAETYGLDTVNAELEKRSVFYEVSILGDDAELLREQSTEGETETAAETTENVTNPENIPNIT